MKRYYHNRYTVRYDEGNCYGVMKPATFVRYMQDIASMDAEEVQLGGEGNWVVKRSVIFLPTAIPVHTPLDMKTYGIGFTRITAQRAYYAHIVGQEEQKPVAFARTLWVYVDQRGRPTRLPEKIGQIWLPDGPEPQIAEKPWSPFPQSEPAYFGYTILFSDTDVMKHINNAAYIDILDNAGWESYKRVGITPDNAYIEALDYDIEYLESARLGEKLDILTWLDPLPEVGHEFVRLQQVMRDGKLLIKVRSRWIWH